MPFGLTGAPTTFGEMVMMALDDMIGHELEAYVNDICLSGDDFRVKFSNLRKFFHRCQEKQLSLSPPKTKLFMSEVFFAGAGLSWDGIKPNLDKLSAILDWLRPSLEAIVVVIHCPNAYTVMPKKPNRNRELRRSATAGKCIYA